MGTNVEDSHVVAADAPQVWVPLRFWFNTTGRQALPLVALADIPSPPPPWRWRTKRFKPAEPAECGLCLCTDCKPQRGFGTQCVHTFHEKCLRELFDRGIDVCPMCRAGKSAEPPATVFRVPPITVQFEGTPE